MSPINYDFELLGKWHCSSELPEFHPDRKERLAITIENQELADVMDALYVFLCHEGSAIYIGSTRSMSVGRRMTSHGGLIKGDQKRLGFRSHGPPHKPPNPPLYVRAGCHCGRVRE